MKSKLIAMFLCLPIYGCYASTSINDMQQDMKRLHERQMQEHYDMWDRIETRQERDRQDRANRAMLERQGGKLFGR